MVEFVVVGATGGEERKKIFRSDWSEPLFGLINRTDVVGIQMRFLKKKVNVFSSKVHPSTKRFELSRA